MEKYYRWAEDALGVLLGIVLFLLATVVYSDIKEGTSFTFMGLAVIFMFFVVSVASILLGKYVYQSRENEKAIVLGKEIYEEIEKNTPKSGIAQKVIVEMRVVADTKYGQIKKLRWGKI
ncbi:MAG: hypothetical protein V1804_02860 [Patescibacteria group bacterium]